MVNPRHMWLLKTCSVACGTGFYILLKLNHNLILIAAYG